MSIAIGVILIILGVVGFVFSYVAAFQNEPKEFLVCLLFGLLNSSFGVLELAAFSVFGVPIGILLVMYGTFALVMVVLSMKHGELWPFFVFGTCAAAIGYAVYWQFSALV